MWFKNLQLHRLPAPWSVTPEQMEKWLAPHAFAPGNSVEMQSHGWASPRDNDSLVYSLNGQMLLVFRAEKKLLPASVVTQVTKARRSNSKSSRASNLAASRCANSRSR
jgi:DNA recombination-dependent growth factor C